MRGRPLVWMSVLMAGSVLYLIGYKWVWTLFIKMATVFDVFSR